MDEKDNVVDIVILKADEEENEDKNFEFYETIPIYSLDNKDNSSKPGSESRDPNQGESFIFLFDA